jgi:Tfp pilus assembly protein PilV
VRQAGSGGHAFERRAKRRGAGAHGDEGVTLIEVLVAFVILLVTILPLTYLLTSSLASASDARQRQAALQLADSWLEILSNSSLPTVGGSPVTNQPQNPTALINTATTPVPKTTLAGTNFNVTAEFIPQSVDNQGQSDLCSSGQPPSQAHPAVIVLQVTVSWNGGNSSVSDTTALNYPTPGLQTQGFLAVQVSNAGTVDVNGNSAASRLQAVPVKVTQTAGSGGAGVTLSPNPLVLYPDQNGCVFAQVPTGTYKVEIASQPQSGTPAAFNNYGGSPPFVNTTGSTTELYSNQMVTVTAETIVQLDAFDEGITSSISYGGATAIADGVVCPGSSRLTCVATGNAPNGASAAWGGSGSTWNSTSFSGITDLNQVGCTSGSGSTCVGVGEYVGSTSASGVIRTTSTDLGTTSSDTVPASVTDITQVACPSTNGCYALGTSASGPVLLAGAVGQTAPQSDDWTVLNPTGITITGLSSLACPTTSTCEVTGSAQGLTTTVPMVLRLSGDPATLATTPSWTPTVSSDSLPSTVTTVTTITCPTTTLCEALGTGDSTGTTDPTILTTTLAASGPSAWSNESTFPTGATSVTGLSCTASTCVAIGSTAAPVTVPVSPPLAAAWTADLSQSTHDWTTASGPNLTSSSVKAFSSVSCGQPGSGDTADCVISATTTTATGQLLVGSLTNGSWAWNPATIPSGSSVRYYIDVACESAPSASRSVCAAVGATPTGPIILTTSSGPSGSWTAQTPASLPGATVSGIPLETAPAGTTNWSTQVTAGGGTNATTLPSVLFPQPNGYSIAAGDCLAEGTAAAITPLGAAPGGNATATIPLGLLPLQVVNPTTGAPVSGATVTLTATTCGGSNGDHYSLPVTDAYGLTQTSVPYGTYSYTVTSRAGVTTTPSTTLFVDTGDIVQSTSSTPVYLPGPAVVPSQ